MASRISATEAARNFSELLNRVRFRGESFDVVRGGEVVARITTASSPKRAGATELIAALAAVDRRDASFAADLERIQSDQPRLPDDPWDS
jgi:antitoxin (DNA-binding transcriptional repressor) of toxin-antitoxin stability system